MSTTTLEQHSKVLKIERDPETGLAVKLWLKPEWHLKGKRVFNLVSVAEGHRIVRAATPTKGAPPSPVAEEAEAKSAAPSTTDDEPSPPKPTHPTIKPSERQRRRRLGISSRTTKHRGPQQAHAGIVSGEGGHWVWRHAAYA